MTTRYPTRRWEVMARGAALEAEGGRLRFLPPTARPGSGWDLPIGPGPLEVAELVRVFGSVETGPRGSHVWVDHYVPLSAGGYQLAAGVATGLNDYPNGWFPVAAVRRMAEDAGVGYREDEIVIGEELITKYPMLVPAGAGLRGAPVRIAASWGFGTACLAFIVVRWVATGANWWAIALVGAVTVLTAQTAIWSLPPMQRRWARRVHARRLRSRQQQDEEGRPHRQG